MSNALVLIIVLPRGVAEQARRDPRRGDELFVDRGLEAATGERGLRARDRRHVLDLETGIDPGVANCAAAAAHTSYRIAQPQFEVQAADLGLARHILELIQHTLDDVGSTRQRRAERDVDEIGAP